MTGQAPGSPVVDRSELLARFDAQMRRDPVLDPGVEMDRSEGVVRLLGPRSWISYWQFAPEEAESTVRREVERFRSRGGEVEWKVYGHDLPAGLAGILAEHGFVPEEPETLMLLEIQEAPPGYQGSEPIRIRRVDTEEDLRSAVALSEQAFAPEPGWELREYLPRLTDASLQIYIAYVRDQPVSAGRLELPPQREFASLWGGGTVASFRGRGAYRALVAARTEEARARGYRYLIVDARETSRPILERVGFRPMTSIVGWVLRP